MATIFRTLLAICLQFPIWGNSQPFSRQDSLRGGLRPERDFYDIHYVELELEFDIEGQEIAGNCELRFNRMTSVPCQKMQLDLASQFLIDRIESGNQVLEYTREGNVIWCEIPQENYIRIFYRGKPQMAKNAPWDGGFVWSKDPAGNPWIGVACEGIGASIWWPLKDYLGDEPDSMLMRFTIPDTLVCVANGNLIDTIRMPRQRKQWIYQVSCPINSYNVSVNIAKYLSFNALYKSKEQGTLVLKYHVLEANEAKARAYFPKETVKMLDAFEHYFGPYPCYADGYGLVETPYWGMEHQGIISYGNDYQKLPRFGFDFILVHESGHEWWGNSISCTDHAEMWIHEGFTTYSEALYLEYHSGYKKSLDYLALQKFKIKNTSPMMGPLGLNYSDWGHSDNYYKGTWFLHSLRHTFKSDEKWFNWLKKFSITNRYQFQSTEKIQESIANTQEIDRQSVNAIFNQYLYDTRIPRLILFRDKENRLLSRWENCVEHFSMPIYQDLNRSIRIDPGSGAPIHASATKKLKDWIEERYYIEVVLPEN